MDLGPDTRLVIDPEFRLKNDVDRALLVVRPRPLSQRSAVCHYLHPKRAVLLALFDGVRSISEVKDAWEELLERPKEVAVEEVDRMVERHAVTERDDDRALVDASEIPRDKLIRYDPQEFVVHRDRVNLTDPRFRKPYYICFLPTLFCPQKCVYCYAKTCPVPEEEPLSLGRVHEIFSELAEIGVEVVTFSGGDPFARKGIFEILESLAEVGIVPLIPTKAGLGYRQMLRLRDIGIETLQVSLDSADSGIVDQMVGLPGYHRKLWRLMDDLKRAGMRVRTNSVLTPINASTIGGLLDYLGSLGNVDVVNLSFYGRSMFCHEDKLFIERHHVEQLRDVVEYRRSRYPWMRINIGGVPPGPSEDIEERRRLWKERGPCSANRAGFILLPDGRVTVCEQLYDHPSFIIGDLRKQSVMEMWNSPRALSLKRPDQAAVPDGPCKSCSEFEECNSKLGRCWRDVIKAYGWHRHHYPDPRCPAAPLAPRLA